MGIFVRRAVAASGLLLVAVLGVGCTTGSDSSAGAATSAAPQARDAATAAGGATSAASSAAASAESDSGSSASGGGGGAGAPEPVVPVDDRQVIRTASVTVGIDVKTTGNGATADNEALTTALDEAGLKVRALAGSTGYVSASDSKGKVSTYTLRIPADGYESVMTSLADIGAITARQEKAEDVTSQMIDIDSRLETMEASVVRVRALLTEATALKDVVALEAELSKREGELESLQRQLASLSGQVGLSTITVVLQGRIVGVPAAAAPPPPPAESTGFTSGLSDGWTAFKSFAKVCLAILGAVLPFIPVVLVLAVIALLVRRRMKRPIAGPPAVVSAPVDPKD
ncbi:DUF4349 domain-containing protein [Nakamurella sp. YIM 132087]|uniref:DUF4349 domain-containing protein n=1 Tax=Nakamurella alba TaxID=2665158 RepID=A0A7K1FSK2_9ACTN|nr:DUF4349 domain-containing protein [Nakamurella alba]MTD16153.1 DUF4349 domain-containing protein [Nakamurella alba]